MTLRMLHISFILWLLCATGVGCMFTPTGGQAIVDAWSIENDYRYTKPLESGSLVGISPEAEQLTPLPTVILVPYYHQLRKRGLEFLKAVHVDGQGGELEYPRRSWPSVPFVMFGNAYQMGYGAIAFSEGCWPAHMSVFGSGGPSRASESQNHMYPCPEGYAARLRPVLYKSSREFDKDIARAFGWSEKPSDDWMYGLFAYQMDDLFKAIDESALSPEGKRLVYRQLLQVTEGVLKFDLDAERKAVYEEAFDRLDAKAK